MRATTHHHGPVASACVLALAIPLFAVVSGCATTTARVRINAPPDRLGLLAVAPVELRYDDRSFEKERRSEDVLIALWQTAAWPVLGPTEFDVIDVKEPDPLRGTDVLIKTRTLGVRPEQVAVLRTIVSVREARGSATVTGRGPDARGGDYSATAVVHMSLTRSGGRVVADLEVTEPIDAFAETPDADPMPAIRIALRKAVKALAEACDGFFNRAPAVPIFATIPSAATIARGYSNPDLGAQGGPGAPRIVSNSVEHEARIWRAAQYFTPDISMSDALRQDRNPPGFCIVDAEAPFRPGDCIVSAAGAPAHSPHVLRRLRALRPDAQPLMVTVVDSNGVAREVALE